ncbi:MAG TPA: helix-turn-helix domain-containing protein [Solirubrobacteraceae bacterium]|nr:helix-turn-helix domain-containing protein [Solirubrobacteraceae bacterium]
MEIPLRADAERNRQRLLAAAKELFATRGVDVTLDDIARHAGVGTGTAYRRFPNKDALIEALMADRIAELGALAQESLEDPDPWRAFAGFFERALALMAADRGLKEVVFSPGRGRERVAHARRAIAPVVTKLVKRAVDAGVVRPDIATSDVPIINFMLTTVVELSRDVEPELYKRYLAIVLDGLRVKDGDPLPVEGLSVQAFQQALESFHGKT